MTDCYNLICPKGWTVPGPWRSCEEWQSPDLSPGWWCLAYAAGQRSPAGLYWGWWGLAWAAQRPAGSAHQPSTATPHFSSEKIDLHISFTVFYNRYCSLRFLNSVFFLAWYPPYTLLINTAKNSLKFGGNFTHICTKFNSTFQMIGL